MRKLSLVLCLICFACSSTKPVAVAPQIPAARKAAVGKLVRAVRRAREQSRDKVAVALLQQAVTEDPTLWEARYNLGVLLAEHGKLNSSREQLSRAHELAPNAEDVVVALAEVSRRLGEGAFSVEILEQFVDSFPEAFAARMALVSSLRGDRQAQRAIEEGRVLLRMRPKDARALAELALSHLAQGEVEVAELLSQQALAIVPPVAVAERAAGRIALEQGDDALAFSHFSKATRLDPKDTAAGLRAAEVFLRAGIYSQAEGHFRKVLAVEPESRKARLGLAAALRGQGDRDAQGPLLESEKVLLGLLKEREGDWAASYNLALLYSSSLERSAEAVNLYEQYLAQAPSNHWARKKAEQWVGEYRSAQATNPSQGNPGQ